MITRQTINSFFGGTSTMYFATHKFNGLELFETEKEAIDFVNEKQLLIIF